MSEPAPARDERSLADRYRLRPIERLTPARAGLAIATGLVATAVTYFAMPMLTSHLFVVFLLAILGSALAGGLWSGLLTTAVSVLGVAVIAFEPVGMPWARDPLDIARMVMLAFFGVLVSVLSQVLRAALVRLEAREQESRVGEESFRALFDSTADAIYVIGPNGLVQNANRAAAVLHGMERDEMIGGSWEVLVDSERNDLIALRATLEAAFGGQEASFEAWARHKSGRAVPVEARLTATRYFGRSVIIAVARDLTERRRLESQLRQSQKMDAIGRLAGGVAHDFNNLLTSIRGYASLMRDRVSHDPTLLEDLDEIERAVEVATTVTGQLLAFSRKHDSVPRAVSLNEALDQTESLLRRLLDERVELIVERDPALGLALLDEGQVEQVIMNLVVNARDAIRGRGRVVIRTRNVVTGSPPTQHVALSVSDDGIGMDDPLRARIFEPFFTTKEVGHGTGLGLSTVYGIVRQSGGSIDVESAPGAGSTFTVYFPRVDRPADAAAGPRERKPAPAPTPSNGRVHEAAGTAGAGDATGPHAAGTGRTVLLAEDEAPVRHLVRRLLTRRGYRVIEAANGREALELARAHEGAIDVLLTDVRMPELTGPELAEQLRAERPGLPVLFTSGYNDQGMDGTGIVPALGIAFLQKPFEPDELLRLLGELLEHTPEST